MLGNSLSKNELYAQASRRYPAKPEPEAIQVFALLQTVWGAVSQLGGTTAHLLLAARKRYHGAEVAWMHSEL